MNATAELRAAIREDMREALRAIKERRIAREMAAQRAQDRLAGKVGQYDLLAAKRRDELTQALDYPMTTDELVAACHAATRAAKVPAEMFDDVAQTLKEQVAARHGWTPPRVKVRATWLRQRAQWIYLDAKRATERAEGIQAAAEQVAEYSEDRRRSLLAGMSGGDYVYALAARTPTAEISAIAQTRALDPEAVAKRLDLSPKWTEALTAVLDLHRVKPLTDKQRDRFRDASAMLRRKYSTPEALLIAALPETYSAALLVDAAIRSERERGSHRTLAEKAPHDQDRLER